MVKLFVSTMVKFFVKFSSIQEEGAKKPAVAGLR